MGKKKTENTQSLITCIVDAIEEKKGQDIVSLELGKLPNAICNHFIICHAESTTQVEAIAENIEDKTLEVLNEKVWQKGGYENKIWIILDFVDVVVHVFQTEWRQFYKLEQLWADAKTTYHSVK
ncbi:MAG TPA: ribosome silencing factor [Tenuifilaceae bacterium]|nr:ribosome silencing factor [Tenuifilaceae bacterium]HPE18600.1 ribosome silencing factor [Tenuifilaceae bacterium]HPJ46029.1 ribosome silencing factor [Tenuifilaceae bacterium]HPQ34732.1 ribosome silencing factor [Tenuifilaceae bacterium]HRX67361.1 ribosome silencing factor [Tenuifilaceae bacterium]